MGERRVVRSATDEEALRLGLVPGMSAEWVDVTSTERAAFAWVLASEWDRTARRCSRRRCPGPPVVRLWRPHAAAVAGLAGYLFCGGHLAEYGRIVEGGRILALEWAEAPQ